METSLAACCWISGLASSLNLATFFFFLLGHKKQVGEADPPVPQLDLPKLRVNRQNLRGCVVF